MKVTEKIGDIERVTEITPDELKEMIYLYRHCHPTFKEKLGAFILTFLTVEENK